MGSDNLHHKRKQQTLNALQRKRSKRESYDVVLIVCEGEKTEPGYLQHFCDELKLNTANFKILGVGVDPLTIVERALEKYRKDKDYDRIYCVFDKDQHANYNAAMNKINSLRTRAKNPIPIYAITSIPCFEYWLLLHFTDSTRPYIGTGSKSAGDLLLNEIKAHIKDYYKGHKNIFEKTKANLQTAIVRAKKNIEQQIKNGTDNPSTNFYELIEYLNNIKK